MKVLIIYISKWINYFILGADLKILIWNVGTAEILHTINHPDLIWSVCWNWEGTRLVTTCKDKKIRIYDPRSGEMEQV